MTPYRISWIILTIDSVLSYTEKNVGILSVEYKLCYSCSNLYTFCYERDFMISLSV